MTARIIPIVNQLSRQLWAGLPTQPFAATGLLADTLARIPDHKINRIDDLLPWNAS